MAPASASAALPARPKHWDKMVSAAYLRILRQTQEQAAEAVGRSARTVREWESSPLWPEAQAEARQRWLDEAADRARKAVLDSLDMGNADLGFRLLERVDPALAPPKVRNEHSGPGGAPIPMNLRVEFVGPVEDE